MTDISTFARHRAAAALRVNPFAQECERLARRIAELRQHGAGLLAAIKRYEDYDLESTENARMAAVIGRAMGDGQLKWFDEQLAALDAKCAESTSAASSAGVLSRMMGKGRRHLKAVEYAQLERTDLVVRRAEYDAERQAHVERLTALAGELERHSGFDYHAACAQVELIKEEILTLNSRAEQTKAENERVDRLLAPLLDSLADTQAQIDELEREIARARQLQDQLKNASTPGARRAIHDACIDEFNTARPADVIASRQRRRPKLDSDQRKLIDRLRLEAAWAARAIRRIVVDGSNLCFVDRKPIGLGALEAAVAILAPQYEVIVVFDGHIHRKLGIEKRQMLDRIGRYVKVHLARGRADATVVELASDLNTYIISNDWFKDYSDRDAVAQGRVIRHEIVDDTVLIHPLKVDARFAPQAPEA